ncbi:ShlB/FhaC/HecB family hemolysin secretion/activation protein [Providencia hangzhouensis]|uniref:ShlB/FhaC/HecB family hemolysin secretion/activation protein n=1 Tax=Providencia hangzhouensis TaxID=3031799 RepID=UPI0034DDB7FC
MRGCRPTFQQRDLTSLKLGVSHRQNINNSTIDASIYYQRNVPWFGAEESWDMKYGDVSKMSRVYTANIQECFPSPLTILL